jgi:ABC-type multidrug transport system fused ATPase/permease subunit
VKARAASAAWQEARLLLRRHRRPLALALVLVVVNRAAAVALPLASRYVVDDVIGPRRTDLLLPVVLFVCGAVALEAATGLGAAQLAGVAGQRAIAELRQGLQERMLGLPMQRIHASQSGILAARVMTDSEQLRYLVGSGLVQLGSSLLTAALALGILFWLHAPLTLALVALLGLFTAGFGGGFRRISTALERASQRQAEVTGRLVEQLADIRSVKAYVAERAEAHRFARESHQLLRENVGALGGISRFGAAGTILAGATGALLLAVGGRAAASGMMSLGSLVMYLSLTGLLLSPVIQLAAGAGEMGKAVAALGRIAELRALATEEEEDRLRTRGRRVAGTVDVEDVSYAYVPGQLALRQVSLHAAAGSTTAFVGPNGSGKSTLCRLLLAQASPSGGRILIDGCDLASFRRRDYRAQVGVVFQDEVLLDGTIADNIRYGRPGTSLLDVRRIGQLAHCDEFVDRLPKGYLTVVGEGSRRLSAGQRQRVAIARALLVDPRILILDEATSNLDAESELLIRGALRRLCRDRTTFVIAHCFSTVRRADQILVLDRGAIVERGTHEELLAKEGWYWRWCQKQWGREPGRSEELAHGR